MYFKEIDGAFVSEVRNHMAAEVRKDLTSGRLYRGAYLTNIGWEQWPGLLQKAVQCQTTSWLANQLVSNGLLLPSKNGKKVPVNAAEMLAEGEFNRFYCRGVCLKAIDLGIPVTVYRGKNAAEPRWRSEEILGTSMDPHKVLSDLRDHIGRDLIEGVPGGPNSGISLMLFMG